jgi:flavin-dependent dehydrogenase
MYDIVIVGGGPAGATLARMVGRTHRTLLLERRPARSCELGPREAKCCGGLLAPDAQRALAALGLGVPREVLAGPQLFAVRAVDAPSGLVRHYQRHYLNVDRGRFDGWLRSLLPPEVEVRLGARVTALRDEGEAVAVETEVTGGRTVVRGRLVVGADGAGSLVRRLAFPGAAAPSSYVAIQEWFEAPYLDPCYTVLFDPALTDFYGWAIPKAGRLVVGAALGPGPGAPARFDRMVEAFRGVGLRMGRSLGREGTLLDRPSRPSQLFTGGGRVALVGEAAGLVSPSSAEGVSFALRSAALLAEALSPAREGWADRYRAATRSLRRGLILKTLKTPLLYTPALRRLVMASGLGATRVGAPPVLTEPEAARCR